MTIAQLGVLLCALGVACGAFGAHALEKLLDQQALSWWDTATTYLWYHALGILALAYHAKSSSSVTRVVWRMILPGVILFSGSLYLYAFTRFPTFGMITPIGGTLMLVGWVRLGYLLRPRSSMTK